MKNVLLICTQPQSGLNIETVLISVGVATKVGVAPKVSLPPSFNFILEETLKSIHVALAALICKW